MSEAPTSAFIAFLNCEAKNCEERAKNLRATANAIEAKAPPPGAAQSVKKDKRDEKSKRVHLAYSEFIKVNIEQFKKSNPDVPARELVSIMSRQWANTSEEEKSIWRFRAEQLDMEQAENEALDHHHDLAAAAAVAVAAAAASDHAEDAEKPASLKDPPPDGDEILTEV